MDILIDIEIYISVRTYYIRQKNMLDDLNVLGKKANKNVPDLEKRKDEIRKKISDSEKQIRELDSKIIIELSELSKDLQSEVLASLENSIASSKDKEVSVSLALEALRDENGFGSVNSERFNYFVRPNNLGDDYFELEDNLLAIRTRLQDLNKFSTYLRSMTVRAGDGLKKGLN